MSRYWNDNGFYDQPTASVIKKNAGATRKKEKAKGKLLEPVVVSGRNVVNKWWGKAWCDNLKQYADYESRLERGKRYVRAEAVIDLKIQKGRILARVQGNRKIPYKVEIRISPLSEEHCQNIINKCGNRIDNLVSLLEGDFPEELKDLFLGKNGLFPTPREISFDCSCPDWALLCKHVAAALYGVGARLDKEPALFFQLRGIDVERFVDVTIANKVEAMLANVNRSSDRIITEDSAIARFGVL